VLKNKQKKSFIITIDTDWAPEPVLNYVFSILSRYDFNYTVFSTNSSSIIESLNKNYEISIHPNFLAINNIRKNYKVIIDELLNIYPNSKGVRSHNLFEYDEIINYYHKIGFLYDSNIFAPYAHIPPFFHYCGLLRIPYMWEDQVHFILEKEFVLNTDIFKSSYPSILCFHPIHIYLNTENIYRYINAKKYYHKPNRLKTIVNNTAGKKGVYDYLLELLEHIKINDCETLTLSMYHNNFKLTSFG